MTKWLRLETARNSEVYQKIVDEAVSRLHDKGHFAKADVLEATGFGVLDEGYIRWDFVKRIIEEDHSTELVPLAASFFKRHAKAEEARFPGRYIALGHGKKTVGFAIVSMENGHFVLQHLRSKRARAKGARLAADETLLVAKRAAVAGSDRIADLRDDPDGASLP